MMVEKRRLNELNIGSFLCQLHFLHIPPCCWGFLSWIVVSEILYQHYSILESNIIYIIKLESIYGFACVLINTPFWWQHQTLTCPISLYTSPHHFSLWTHYVHHFTPSLHTVVSQVYIVKALYELFFRATWHSTPPEGGEQREEHYVCPNSQKVTPVTFFTVWVGRLDLTLSGCRDSSSSHDTMCWQRERWKN